MTREHALHDNFLVLRDTTNGVVPRSQLLPIHHANKDTQYGKRRKVKQRHYTDSVNAQETVLIPLDRQDRQDGNREMRQPAIDLASGTYESRHDHRIIALPPRDSEASKENQRVLQTASHQESAGGRLTQRGPQGHVQVPLKGAVAYRHLQPSSLATSDHSSYHRQSPIVLHASQPAQSVHEAHDSYPPLRHEPTTVNVDGYHTARENFARVNEEGREMQYEMQNMDIDDQRRGAFAFDTGESMAIRRAVYDPTETPTEDIPSAGRSSQFSRNDSKVERPQGLHEYAGLDNSPRTWNVQYDQSLRPSHDQGRRHIEYIPQQVSHQDANPTGARLPRLVPVHDEQRWFDLQSFVDDRKPLTVS